jgi:hypothetical protein
MAYDIRVRHTTSHVALTVHWSRSWNPSNHTNCSPPSITSTILNRINHISIEQKIGAHTVEVGAVNDDDNEEVSTLHKTRDGADTKPARHECSVLRCGIIGDWVKTMVV